MLDKLLSYIKSPLGTAYKVDEIEKYTQEAIATWNNSVEEVKTGWFGWFGKRKADFTKATNYLLGCLDLLINTVENKIKEGVNKKATVVYAMENIYDNIIRPALPIYLIPFAPAVKYIIIYVVVSTMIDFMVKKYKDGEWNNEETKEEAK